MITKPRNLTEFIDLEKSFYFDRIRNSIFSNNKDLTRDIQNRLRHLKFYRDRLDGLFGPKTKKALNCYLSSQGYADNLLTTVAARGLRKGYYHNKFASQEPIDDTTKTGMIRAIITACSNHGLPLIPQMAYVLATVEHETMGKMKPVKEAYWLSEAYRKSHFRYYPFYGRGLVQITHKTNYALYSDFVGLDLVKHPRYALLPDVAVYILVSGMALGMFTGKRLSLYINRDKKSYYDARRVINGTDRARLIADLATIWEDRLINGDF